MMKKILLGAAFLILFSAMAESFPDPIAEFRGQPIPLSAVEEQLKSLGDLSPDDRTGRQAALRKELEGFCCSIILQEIFHKPEYRDGRAAAHRYIAEQHLDEVTTRELEKQVEDPAFIRKAILHLFLASYYGEESFAVSYEEIEAHYRDQIERFRIAEDIVFAIIVVDDLESAKTLHARIQQGENFERLAQENDDGRKRPVPTANELMFLRQTAAKMKINAVSPILSHNNRYFILKLKKHTPATFVPLAKIKDSLKMELIALREAKLLQKYLADEIDGGNLVLK